MSLLLSRFHVAEITKTWAKINVKGEANKWDEESVSLM